MNLYSPNKIMTQIWIATCHFTSWKLVGKTIYPKWICIFRTPKWMMTPIWKAPKLVGETNSLLGNAEEASNATNGQELLF